MKSTTNVAVFLLCLPFSTLTVAFRFERSEPALVAESAPTSANSKIQVLDFQTDIDWVELEVPGYEKGSLVEPPVREFIPTYHWTGTKDIQTRELMQRQGFCLYLAQCPGLLRDFAAYYGTQAWGGLTNWCSGAANLVLDYYTVNNYENAKATLNGVVGNLIIFVPVTIAGFYLTARIAKIEGAAATNTCGARQPAVIAEQSANGLFQFCLSIRDHSMAATTTRYVSGDMSTNHPVFDDSDGLLLIKQFYIGTNRYDTAAVCQDYGVVWRSDFAAALKRGDNRSFNKLRSGE